jgi:hypothetical protein
MTASFPFGHCRQPTIPARVLFSYTSTSTATAALTGFTWPPSPVELGAHQNICNRHIASTPLLSHHLM